MFMVHAEIIKLLVRSADFSIAGVRSQHPERGLAPEHHILDSLRDPRRPPVINVCTLVLTAETGALDKYDKLGL